jgi:hypothetical protein
MLTQKYLQQILHYDLNTGVWTWKQAPRHSPQLLNQPAGTLTRQGTRRIQINGCSYYCHQLAWLYVTGKWSTKEIDHINHKPDDNRWTNLRESNSHQNSCPATEGSSGTTHQGTREYPGTSANRSSRPRSKSTGKRSILGHSSASSLPPGCMIWRR